MDWEHLKKLPQPGIPTGIQLGSAGYGMGVGPMLPSARGAGRREDMR